MRRTFVSWVGLGVGLALAGGAHGEGIPGIEPAIAIRQPDLEAHVRALCDPALEGRGAGSAGEAAARAYVVERFKAAGLEPLGDGGTFEQPFDFKGEQWFPVAGAGAGAEPRSIVGKVEGRSANAIGLIRGRDARLAAEAVVVGAHLDALGRDPNGAVYPGADDDASGIAVLLELARVLGAAKQKPRRSIVLVGFGAEEPAPSLFGSRHYAAHAPVPLERSIAMINIDMVGRGEFLDKPELAAPKKGIGLKTRGCVGLLHRSAAAGGVARDACKRVGLATLAIEDLPDVFRPYIERQVKGRGDFAPFEERGVPYVFFSTSESADYHLPTDMPDTLDFANLRRIAAAICLTAYALADAEAAPPRLDGGK